MKCILLLTLPFLFMLSCGKNGNPPSAPTTPKFVFGKSYTLPSMPEANAAYDTSLRGIYKGVTINALDNAATFQFNVDNGDKSIYAREFMNGGERDSLVRYMIDSATQLLKFPLLRDSALINTGARFYTVFESFLPDSGNAYIQFGVSPGGVSPVMDVNLSANQTLDAVLKEPSNRQVFCFEGSYSGSYINQSAGPDSGTVAFVVRADTAVVLLASKSYAQFFPAAGSAVNNNQFIITIYDGPGGAAFILTGVISGDTCNGTWVREGSSAAGTFTAHRTL